MWQDIESAPLLERVMVAGWQKPSGSTIGYWWWYEDQTDKNGKPIGHPDALKWHKPIAPPKEPPNA